MNNQLFQKSLVSLAVYATLMFFVATPLQAQNYVDGEDYVTISAEPNVTADGRVEVVEFFWFGCPSCFRFETTLVEWDVPEEINFDNIPAPIVDSWVFHAHAYYAMDLLGLKDQLMQKFYDEIHVKRNRVSDIKSFERWANEQEGIDVPKLIQTLQSFAAKSKVAQAEALAKKYGINSVPNIVVGRKYRTSPAMAGSDQRAIEVVEFLARKILAEREV